MLLTGQKLQEANKQAIFGKGGIVDVEGALFDSIEKDAISGKGKVQAAAQKKLAAILGPDSKAGKIVADNSPQKVAEREAADGEEEIRIERENESNARAKAFRLETARKKKAKVTKENQQRAENKKILDALNDPDEEAAKAAWAEHDKKTGKDKQQVEAIAKQFSGGALGEDIANAITNGMASGDIEAKTKQALASAGVGPNIRDAVTKAVIEDVQASQGAAQNKAVRLPTGKPRTTKLQSKTVAGRVAAAKEANAARKRKDAQQLASRKAAQAARRKPKRQRRDVLVKAQGGGAAPKQPGDDVALPLAEPGPTEEFTNLLGNQAKQTGQVIQSQTAVVSRLTSVENQQRANEAWFAEFHRRNHTMQLRGR